MSGSSFSRCSRTLVAPHAHPAGEGQGAAKLLVDYEGAKLHQRGELQVQALANAEQTAMCSIDEIDR